MSQIAMVIMTAFVIGIAGLHHSIAGSIEVLTAIFAEGPTQARSGQRSVRAGAAPVRTLDDPSLAALETGTAAPTLRGENATDQAREDCLVQTGGYNHEVALAFEPHPRCRQRPSGL